eukprot:288284_1
MATETLVQIATTCLRSHCCLSQYVVDPACSHTSTTMMHFEGAEIVGMVWIIWRVICAAYLLYVYYRTRIALHYSVAASCLLKWISILLSTLSIGYLCIGVCRFRLKYKWTGTTCQWDHVYIQRCHHIYRLLLSSVKITVSWLPLCFKKCASDTPISRARIMSWIRNSKSKYQKSNNLLFARSLFGPRTFKSKLRAAAAMLQWRVLPRIVFKRLQ